VKENYGETFAVIQERYGASGKISLRRLQFRSAHAGSVQMQKWLGIQQLGQKNHHEISGELKQGIAPKDVWDLMQKSKDENGSNNEPE